MKVTIKALKKDRTGCLLSWQDEEGIVEQWLPFGEKINPDWVHAGEAEVTIREGFLSYVKMDARPKPSPNSGAFPKKRENISDFPGRRSAVEVIERAELKKLKVTLNEFYSNHDIIATQVFPLFSFQSTQGATIQYYDAIIYYKE
jgi:hypothetical protein